MNTGGSVSLLLQAMNAGDATAAERLFPILYDELHRLAAGYMGRERQDHTLQPTALINEAFLRLMQDVPHVENRQHFISIAATVMRRILVDHARRRVARIHGGGHEKLQLDEALAMAEQSPSHIIALNDALERLEQVNPRQAKVVELRFFGGLSVEETAAALNIAPRSVKRDWALARIWLHAEISKA
jgi:RNA polymerase sigma factor (TIGR02999 family)